MGFTINETVKVELHYTDIANICIIFYEYKTKNSADKRVLQGMEKLINRLGIELANHPDNDKPNEH